MAGKVASSEMFPEDGEASKKGELGEQPQEEGRRWAVGVRVDGYMAFGCVAEDLPVERQNGHWAKQRREQEGAGWKETR